jgi:hypothetical protein
MEHQAAIKELVTAVLTKWTAMKLAISNGWGTTQSRDEFIDTLTSKILEFEVDEDYLIELLEIEMEDTFEVVLEDDSAKQVARTLLAGYNDIISGRNDVLEEVKAVESADVASSQKTVATGNRPVLNEGSEGSNSGPEEEEKEDLR